jgi:hypothetical protein
LKVAGFVGVVMVVVVVGIVVTKGAVVVVVVVARVFAVVEVCGVEVVVVDGSSARVDEVLDAGEPDVAAVSCGELEIEASSSATAMPPPPINQ